jgi:small-conductance mechanosensitive channel
MRSTLESQLSALETQLSHALDSLTALAFGLVEAIVVIVIARYIHRFVNDRVLRRLDSPELSESGRTAIGILTTAAVGIAAATVLLALWGVTWSGIVAAISLGTLGLLLGIQDVLKSLIGGIFLLLERPYSIGDRIQVRDVTGRVIQIELRTTVLRSDQGHRIVAPNSIVFTDTLTNFSRRRQIRTTLILSGISGTTAELRTSIGKALEGIDDIEGTPEVRVRTRRSRLTAPIRDGHSDPPPNGHISKRNIEAWISWLGGGEPEVQAAVIARLKELFPQGHLRARTVSGTVVPQSVDVPVPARGSPTSGE